MSDMDFVNFMMIDDVDRNTKNNEKLGDLRDKAAFLAKKTGQEPASWYEFKQAMPKEEPHTLRNLAIGAAIGVAIGLGVGGLALPLGFLGAALGVFSDTQSSRRKGAIEKYETYLDAFEQSGGKARAYAIEQMPPLREGGNVAKLKEHGCGCGRAM